MSWDAWIQAVAELLNMEPDDVLYEFPQARSLLYDGGASPREAADMIRLYS